jgi:hypothetical protein
MVIDSLYNQNAFVTLWQVRAKNDCSFACQGFVCSEVDDHSLVLLEIHGTFEQGLQPHPIDGLEHTEEDGELKRHPATYPAVWRLRPTIGRPAEPGWERGAVRGARPPAGARPGAARHVPLDGAYEQSGLQFLILAPELFDLRFQLLDAVHRKRVHCLPIPNLLQEFQVLATDIRQLGPQFDGLLPELAQQLLDEFRKLVAPAVGSPFLHGAFDCENGGTCFPTTSPPSVPAQQRVRRMFTRYSGENRQFQHDTVSTRLADRWSSYQKSVQSGIWRRPVYGGSLNAVHRISVADSHSSPNQQSRVAPKPCGRKATDLAELIHD